MKGNEGARLPRFRAPRTPNGRQELLLLRDHEASMRRFRDYLFDRINLNAYMRLGPAFEARIWKRLAPDLAFDFVSLDAYGKLSETEQDEYDRRLALRRFRHSRWRRRYQTLKNEPLETVLEAYGRACIGHYRRWTDNPFGGPTFPDDERGRIRRRAYYDRREARESFAWGHRDEYDAIEAWINENENRDLERVATMEAESKARRGHDSDDEAEPKE